MSGHYAERITAIGLGALLLLSGSALAQTGQIQLDVTRVYDINGDIDLFFDQADYYCIAKVAAGADVTSPIVSNKDEADLDFTVFETVLRTERFHPVHIELWDSDDDIVEDDLADINPNAGKSTLDLIFDACTFTWSGDLNGGARPGLARGFGDDDPAELIFNITTADGVPFSPDDVAIRGNGPVQVTFDPDGIVEGKPTSFQLEFGSSYTVPRSGTVTVTLTDGEGNTATETRNITVPPEGLTTYLFDGTGTEPPFVPHGNFNAATLCWTVMADFGIEGPPGGLPIGFENCYGANNQVVNNCKRLTFTDDPRTEYLPFDWDTGMPYEFPTGAESSDSYDDNEKFRLATTPIKDLRSSPPTSALGYPLPGPAFVEPFLTMIVLTPAVMLSGIDRMVLLTRPGWFSDNIGASDHFSPNQIGVSLGESVPHVVIAEAGRSQVAIHEIDHTYRLSRRDCTTASPIASLFDAGCRDEYLHFPGGPMDPYPASGFDVSGDVYPTGFSPGTPGTREVFTTNIMGTAGAATGSFDRWIDDLNYNYLLREMGTLGSTLPPMESAGGPTATSAVSLTGFVIATNGIDASIPVFTGELLPSFQMPIDNVALALEEAVPGESSGYGPFAVKLVTPQGARTYRFLPAIFPAEGEDPVDVAMFGIAVPWDDSTTRMELHGPTDLNDPSQSQDTLLFAIDRTAAVPALQNVRFGIDVVPTQAGSQPEPPTIPPTGTLAIGWDIVDPDSTAFSTSLLLVPPQGTSLGPIPLIAGLTGGEYIIPAQVRQRIPAGDVEIRIVATDGINTTSVHDPIIARFCDYTNGGVESCDGLDNDCDGIVDNAAVPALVGGLQLTEGDLSWDPAPGASAYDVIHGDLLSLRSASGDFAAAIIGCLAEDLPATSLLNSEPPPVSGGTWYLVRPRNCGGDAPWDGGGVSQDPGREASIAAAVLSCPDCDHSRCEVGGTLDASCDSCVATVCAADSYCCDTAWDTVCVEEVRTICGNLTCSESAGTCSHTVCREGTALADSCDDPPVNPSCVADICAVDPFCCSTAWDFICVAETGTVCGGNCN